MPLLAPTCITANEGLARFVTGSEVLFSVVLDADRRIVASSPGASRLLQIPAANLQNQPFADFLTAPDSALIDRLCSLSAEAADEDFLLNVVDSNHSPLSLRCRRYRLPAGHLLVGEVIAAKEASLRDELLLLNNELAVVTRDNVRKSRELSRALEELKKAEAMLVHHEKMASLGQMTAGIAHEINNPIAFVLNNQQTLKRDFADLAAFVAVVAELLPELSAASPPVAEKIIGKAREIEIDQLLQGTAQKIDHNLEGLERVKQIVVDLRTFSRLDEAEFKECDLVAGIEATLRFLAPLLVQHKVSIETRFCQLPPIFCSPGALNQAISNVIVNAVQASTPGQTVIVSTKMDETTCVVSVEDHGCGIPAANLGKIYDPFFTTKPVGSGTGLGLSIVHQLLKMHGGKIEVTSTPGQGTRVFLHIPSPDHN